MQKNKAILLLEDGEYYEGISCGAPGETFGELVFNTSMTGYQEILTDPSYHEQIITMTHPHIGNYGTHADDNESEKIWAKGFVVKEMCETPSSWRSEASLPQFLKEHNTVAIQGVDTRKITRKLRTAGVMRAVISTEEFDHKKLLKKLEIHPSMTGRDLAKEVSCRESYELAATKKEKHFVVAFDFGIKTSILTNLKARGCRVKVVQAITSAQEVLSFKPDGVFLSNGPGDPAAVTYAIETIKELIGKVPIFGICLGHQLICLALGASTYKLKFGHRGANQPVWYEDAKRVEITSHNHGFAVASKTLPSYVSHKNLNDHTVEGLSIPEKKILSVQYHPESSPGPRDSLYLFDEFINMMNK